MAKLQVRGIHKRLGGKAVLGGISFDVEPGEIVSLIGPSGSGKTTLLKCILGELAPDGGRVLMDGEDVTHRRVERRRVGVVYQEYALFPHMDVEANIGYGLRVRRVPPEKIAARVAELLELTKLVDKRKKFPHQLSGGEQQRVAVARALAVEPRILLLDEAFTALDATTRTEVMHEVRAIIRRFGLTTLLVTHDQEEAFLFARRVIVLNEGRIVVEGRAEKVMTNAHPFIRDFVKMVMLRRANVQRSRSGERYVELDDGTRIQLKRADVRAGSEVHVMVKKGPQKESVEVWPVEPT